MAEEIDPTQIDFDTYVQMKGEGTKAQEYPGITVGPDSWTGVYVNKRGRELMSVYNKDQFIAAPNPDAPGENEFFICKTTDGDGYTANTRPGAGAIICRSVVSNLGEEFDAGLKYELEETDMTHPNWGTPIFKATVREKHEPNPRRQLAHANT